MVDGHFLRGPRQVSRDHFAVDRIGDRDRAARRDEPQVAHVLKVVRCNRVCRFGAAQERLDYTADPLLAQLVRELI